MPARSSQPLKERSTILDVAQLAGVSISTVSRVINSSGYFSEQTAVRVQSAIEKLNFKPDSNARGLASRRTNALGLIVNQLSSPYIIPLLKGIEEATRVFGYSLLINTQLHMDNGFPVLGDQNTDGLMIIANPGIGDEDLYEYAQRAFPVILMHRIPPAGISLPYIIAENVKSSCELVEHLIVEHDMRRIAFLRGPESEQDSMRREQGYRQALAKHDIEIDPELIGYGGFNEIVAEATISQWIKTGIGLDAIFTGDDGAAVGAYRAAESAGLKIPDDFAVVGFDDDYVAPRLNPPLTTVHVPLEEFGARAVQMLIELIKTGHSDSVTIPTHIEIRRSCGCH